MRSASTSTPHWRTGSPLTPDRLSTVPGHGAPHTPRCPSAPAHKQRSRRWRLSGRRSRWRAPAVAPGFAAVRTRTLFARPPLRRRPVCAALPAPLFVEQLIDLSMPTLDGCPGPAHRVLRGHGHVRHAPPRRPPRVHRSRGEQHRAAVPHRRPAETRPPAQWPGPSPLRVGKHALPQPGSQILRVLESRRIADRRQQIRHARRVHPARSPGRCRRES